MRVVYLEDPGVVCLNYMWLPTFLGMNSLLKQEMEKDLQELLVGTPLDERGLDRAHALVVGYMEKKFPEIRGLGRFLDAMKYLEP